MTSFVFWFAVFMVGSALLSNALKAQDCNHNLNGTHSVLEKRNEAFFVERFAPKYNARVEVRLHEGVRVDLLSDTYAIEVDWARKYYEGFGQAMLYGILTDKKPAVLLLAVHGTSDETHVRRARMISKEYNIKLYVEWIRN